ncbi:MAG: hypothetical protein M4579_005787 [Chaenotheca gracillima]|nr:MAG: hypothetical protein M4579_005787 [Chaenotheca gracillima]
MTDYQTKVLAHYNLQNAFPSEWPAANDVSDDSDEEAVANARAQKNVQFRRSKSRYSALERHGSDKRSSVPGTERNRDGVENLVQSDEPDPLGTGESVVRMLRKRGLHVEDDARLRNRFLLSSTTFSPALFLSQAHEKASAQSLLQGLDLLSRSIDQKSASLKVLVESNFERFVRAKATIDNVYTEMRKAGLDLDEEEQRPRSRSGRASGHFRGPSGNSPYGSRGLGNGKPGTDDRKKNALIKESEYGVHGIKAPLLELSVKAEEVWGPALGGREREDGMKALLITIDKCRDVFEISGNMADCIKRKDYESLVEEYRRARKHSETATNIANEAMERGTTLTEPQINQIIVISRMWAEVEEQIEDFKKDVWRRLVAVQTNFNVKGAASPQADAHTELISILLELGVQDNPIWVWLLSRYDHLKNKIAATSERFKIEIEFLRRRLANGDKPTAQAVASHLRSSSARNGPKDRTAAMDAPDIVDLWEGILVSLQTLLAPQGGILSEVLDFWVTAQSFADGQTQRMLPVGIDSQSRKHHRLSTDGMRDLSNGTIELVNLIRDAVFSFFVDSPVEDISLLFSPIPTSTPNTPISATLSPSPFKDSRFNLDINNIPPPSPRRGEAWEEFAFWPPHSTSLSGVHYLSKLLILVGTAASEMSAMSPVGQAGQTLERLRSMLSACRERCVQAICAAWSKDAENCKALEDWTRSTEKRDLTKMPSQFLVFETNLLAGMQKVLYISEAMTKPGSPDVVPPPPAKLLQMVRSQFVSSLYKSLSGMVENAEKNPKSSDREDPDNDPDSVVSLNLKASATHMTAYTIDASNRNVRMLLTLSNLQALRTDIVPQLITQFENSFSVKLTEESKTIRDVLSQIDSRLFQSFTRPAVEKLKQIIHTGVLAPNWAPTGGRPSEVRPYVYTTLLSLVLVHTQVSTTAASLTQQILSYLLEETSRELLDAFKLRPKFSLAALMQATLDVEFVAQTLSQYTTDRASEVQSQIYLELDRRTDNDARMKLQNELPDMRNILKTLRENSKAEL